MQEQNFIQSLTKRTSIFVIVLGVLLVVIGVANEISVSTVSLKISELWGKLVIIILGLLLIGFGIYLESRERSQSKKEQHKTESQQISNQSESGTAAITAVTRSRFDEPELVSSTKRNHRSIKSDFIHWPECTLMIGVLVPEKEQGLRNAPHYRYILAHNTGAKPQFKYFNLFTLRYTPKNQWQLCFSNNKTETKCLTIEDELEAGWHHFLISWDKSGLVFQIDRGHGGEEIINARYLSYWPEKLSDSITLGAWHSTTPPGAPPYEHSYCDTTLFQLALLDKYVESSSTLVMEHLAKINQMSVRNAG